MNLNSKKIYVKKYTYNPNLHNFFNLKVRDFMDTLYIENLWKFEIFKNPPKGNFKIAADTLSHQISID